MTFQQFFHILSVRRKIVLRTLLGLVFVTILLSLILPKQYTASADVLVDVKSPDPVAGIILPAMIMPAYMATQTDIIGSRRVAMRVIKLLKLDANADIIDDWRSNTSGRGDITVWLADRLLKKLDVKPSKESNVITLSFVATTPEAAAGIANAFAQAYIDTNLELRIAPAAQNAQWFKEQSKVLRDNLQEAQGRLSDFQQKNSIVSGSDNGFDYEMAKLNGLTEQLTLAQSQNADLQSKQSPGASANVLPEVIQNPLIQNLKSSIAQNEAKLSQLGRSLGVNHPDYLRLRDETDELKQQLNTQISRVAASISMANKVGETRGNVLKDEIATQKRKVLEMTALRDQMAVLEKDVDAAQKAYDAVAQRFTETSLESQSNVTNISVLTPAAIPIKHSSPKLVLNTLIAIFMGTLLGIGATLALEMVDRRVRSVADIAGMLGVPVLAELVPNPSSPSRRFRLPAFMRRVSPPSLVKA